MDEEEAENLIDKAATAAQTGVLAVIASRLGKIPEGATEADIAAWETSDFIAINEAMARGRGLIDRAVTKMMEGLDEANREWAKGFYEATGAAESAEASAIIIEGRKEIAKDANSLCRTSAVGIIGRDSRLHLMRDAYKDAVSRAVAAMRAGKSTYQTEIARTAAELARNGLRVRYKSGRSMELYAAVRMNVMDGYRTVMTAQRYAHGEAFGYDGVEVSAHTPCAPDHQPYQGQRYTNERWQEIEGSLGRPLVTGANCRHTTFPVIIGVGKPAYSREDVERFNRESNETVRFKGIGGDELSMSRYDATQYQRGLERSIRKQKTDSYLLKLEGLGDMAAEADNRAKLITGYYRSMSAEVGLTRRDERTKLYV